MPLENTVFICASGYKWTQAMDQGVRQSSQRRSRKACSCVLGGVSCARARWVAWVATSSKKTCHCTHYFHAMFSLRQHHHGHISKCAALSKEAAEGVVELHRNQAKPHHTVVHTDRSPANLPSIAASHNSNENFMLITGHAICFMASPDNVDRPFTHLATSHRPWRVGCDSCGKP